MFNQEQMTAALDRCPASDYLGQLRICGGYYECPVDGEGKRLGPLVAYRGEYEPGKRFVGEVYANYAMAEQYPFVVHRHAKILRDQLRENAWMDKVDVFCGAPEGGKCLAIMMATVSKQRYIYPEKQVSQLVWGRHQAQPGEKVIIVEDVSNNFSTTERMIRLITDAGAKPVAIVTFLNRSLQVDSVYHASKGSDPLPVMALVRKKIQEYRQEDPEVAEDVRAGLVVWNVKEEWPKLECVMANAQV